MSNKLVIELGPESLAAINKLTQAVHDLARMSAPTVEVEEAPTAAQVAAEKMAAENKKAAEIMTPPAAEAVAEEVVEPVPTAEELPVVTMEQLRARVVKMSAAGKKDAVRALVLSYAEKVSDIPAEKLGEVWAKLDALEV